MPRLLSIGRAISSTLPLHASSRKLAGSDDREERTPASFAASINITLLSGNTAGREAIRFHLLVSAREVRDCAESEMNEPRRGCGRNRR